MIAGENLAYGFDTSLGVVNGWMASPTHRDNVLLPDYEEVGFGIANGEDYQGTENTVVVAMYGDPVVSINPTPAPVTQTPSTPPAANPEPVNSPAPVEINETTPDPEANETPAKADTELVGVGEDGDATPL